MNYLHIIIGIIFAICCCIAAYRYYDYYKKKQEEIRYIENKEFLKKAISTESELYFFYTTWCPHCKEAMNTWEGIKKDPRFSKFKVNFMNIDCEDKSNKGLVATYNIEEYPSYVLKLNNKKYIYDANLSNDSLYRFLVATYKQD
jgi:thiol-disulfide isomerase/thioredoxin|tara:strand:+ start:9666 stop:10097 length:432 start_codon:yes stop_codon:yes gene_type:complete